STSYYALHLVHCSPFSLLHHTPPTNIYSLSLHDALPISRGNQTGNADWLAVDVVDLAAWHLVGIIGLRDNQVREETEVFRGTLCLASGLGDGQTGVEGLPGCENLSAGFHDVCNLVEHAGALTRKHGGPRAVLEGIVSRCY